jgi:two-component system, chemotaxis family, protein-glutamate methylesterase/glutaminase
MKILLLDSENIYSKTLQEFSCLIDNAIIITGEEIGNYSSDSAIIDIIIGVGDFSNGSKVVDQLLSWRTHPYTYLVPCWLATNNNSFRKNSLWPALAIDCYQPKLEPQTFCEWLINVAEWQQNRMHLASCNSLKEHSTLELSTALALRKASGRLAVFDEEGGEGSFVFHGGCLTDGSLRHLSGNDAFFEFFSWSQGSYCWEPADFGQPGEGAPALDLLIQDGLRLIRESNLLFHFVHDLGHSIKRTESESALDDSATPHFAARREIYQLIDGKISCNQIVDASPLSRPRTMSILAKWFSLGDIAIARDALPSNEPAGESPPPALAEPSPLPAEQPFAPRRLLIVDDSNLMCKALQDIFGKDPRFEIAGIAHDGLEALSLIERHQPDVVTLDMQMPRMDGLTALKHIMIRDPRPVVIVSAFTRETSQLTYESFKYGAVDVVTKPAKGQSQQVESEERDLCDRVALASCVRLEAAQYIRCKRSRPNIQEPPAPFPSEPAAEVTGTPLVVLVGCGTGGFPALLKFFFTASRATLPAMVTCMAMPKRVVEALAPNLCNDCPRPIQQLAPGVALESGALYIYSYEEFFHLLRDGAHIVTQQDAIAPGLQSPVDHLFGKAAEVLGARVVAVVLSGTGEDGLEGMRAVKQQGGQTFVLSPEACLKPDLPRKILAHGYAQEAKSIVELARLLENCHKPWQENQMTPRLPSL